MSGVDAVDARATRRTARAGGASALRGPKEHVATCRGRDVSDLPAHERAVLILGVDGAEEGGEARPRGVTVVSREYGWRVIRHDRLRRPQGSLAPRPRRLRQLHDATGPVAEKAEQGLPVERREHDARACQQMRPGAEVDLGR